MNLHVVSAEQAWPMVLRWCDHYATTKDSTIDGKTMDIPALLKSIDAIEYMAAEDKGVVAHIIRGGWLEGMMLWIEPEHRCSGNLEAIFDELLNVARRKGLKGIRFESKIWRNGPQHLGFTLQKTQSDGGDIVKTWIKLI